MKMASANHEDGIPASDTMDSSCPRLGSVPQDHLKYFHWDIIIPATIDLHLHQWTKNLCKILQTYLWSLVKKPMALLKHKFNHVVRGALPLAGVSPWSSAGGHLRGSPVLHKVLWGRAGRAGAGQMPGLAGTRQQAASRHRMTIAQVEKRCKVSLILTFPWWNSKEEGGLQGCTLPWQGAMVTSCSRENFVLIKEINLLRAQLNVGIGFCWIMDSSLENFWLIPNGKYPRSVLMGLSIT